MKDKPLLYLFLFTAIFCAFFSPVSGSSKTETLYYIPVEGDITHGMSSFVKRGLDEAADADASLIVLGIDTYGGRVDACLEIVSHIESVEQAPVYAYVTDKAWSAGALIALACQRIIMREGSSIGSAAPVSGGQEMSEKYVSAIRAKFQAVAEKSGHCPNLAVAMVDNDVEIREVSLEGERVILTARQIENFKRQGKEVSSGDLISEKGKLLNLSFRDSLRYGLASENVRDFEELLSLLNMDKADIVQVKVNWAERLALFLTGGTVSYFLMTFGMLFIFLELQEPGFGLPLVLGISCLGVFFLSRHVVHLARWTDFLLFGIGVILILVEIFVIPGFGFAGISGGVLIIVSLYLALSPYTVPRYPWDFQTLQMTLLSLMGSLTVGILGSFALLNHIGRIPGLNRIVLQGTMREKHPAHGPHPEHDREDGPLKGESGTALTDLRPVGKIKLGGSIYDGIADHGFIGKDDKIEVVRIEGNRIFVKRSDEA